MHLFLMTTELLDIQIEADAFCGLLVSVSLVKKHTMKQQKMWGEMPFCEHNG